MLSVFHRRLMDEVERWRREVAQEPIDVTDLGEHPPVTILGLRRGWMIDMDGNPVVDAKNAPDHP